MNSHVVSILTAQDTSRLPDPVDSEGGVLVTFDFHSGPVLVRPSHWVGFDFDGVLSMAKPGNSNIQDLGIPVVLMLKWVNRLLNGGITVKVFTARACELHNVARIQDWTEENGVGRLEVTNAKDYQMIRYYDDRAIQVVPERLA